MPLFSTRSNDMLDTCDPNLQAVFRTVIRWRDCTVLEGHRGAEAQNEAFRTGHSTKQWPDGLHNREPSDAVDVAPYPIDWNDRDGFYHFGGFVLGVAAMLDIRLRWGGDWDMDADLHDQTLFDLVHFERI